LLAVGAGVGEGVVRQSRTCHRRRDRQAPVR
jgi:hypothetical protein